MSKKVVWFSICLFVLLVLASCSQGEAVSPRRIVQKMADAEDSLPAGVIYTSESTLGAPDYLSSEMLEIMYGNGEYPTVFDRVESAAIRLSSFARPGEFAVFRCKNTADTGELAELCFSRIHSLKQLVNGNVEKNGFGAYKIDDETAAVSIVGKYVIMAVSPDAKRSVSIAREMLR